MHRDDWAALVGLAQRQHGLVSIHDLRRLGIPRRSIEEAVAAGYLQPDRRGVYRVAGCPSAPWQPLAAAVLATDRRGVASHFAAGGLHRLTGVAAGQVELIFFDGRAGRLAGVRTHAAGRLTGTDLAEVEGILCTSVARTVVDLAGRVHPRLLSRIVDDVLTRGSLIRRELVTTLDALGGSGVAGSSTLRAQLAARDPANPFERDDHLERLWLAASVRAGLPRPARNFEVSIDGRSFFIDLAWAPWRVGLEVAGWTSHGTRSAFDADPERAALLDLAGWHVHVATSRMRPADVCGRLRRALLAAGADPCRFS